MGEGRFRGTLLNSQRRNEDRKTTALGYLAILNRRSTSSRLNNAFFPKHVRDAHVEAISSYPPMQPKTTNFMYVK